MDVEQMQNETGNGAFPVELFFQNIVLAASDDAFVAFTDAGGVIMHMRKTEIFPFPINTGERIDDPKISKTVNARAWRERRMIKEAGDPALFGMPYVSMANPIFWNGEFAGVIAVVMPIIHHEELKSGVNQLGDQIGVLNMLSGDLADAGITFALNVNSISEAVNELQNNAKALVEINALVGEVAAQTNLLGLNAAIEAARAGELGRGFGVVADEIRRLAQTVKDSSKRVRDKVEEITGEITHIQQSVQESIMISGKQVEQLEELSTTVSYASETIASLKQLG